MQTSLAKLFKTLYSWNQTEYLQEIFRDVDVNNDGTITINELHAALIRGQPSSQFDIITVQLLVRKYDTNHDGVINFEEFENLFNYLNEEYVKFLLADSDGNQTIDAKELNDFFLKRGFSFDSSFSKYIVNTIKLNTQNDITFDQFIRIMARVENLFEFYKNSSNNLSEIQEAFFNEFWYFER